MVFFTCNACGSSLKKNQVEKHYQNECRNCEVLSCMDCGQDFYGDEYITHTKCVSEAEKYQGSMFKKDSSVGKGEKKQQEWLERVKQSVSSAKVNPRVAKLLERVAEYPNIPRKKTKFENFVRNSFNVHDMRTLSELWEAFSGATQKTPAVSSEVEASLSTSNCKESQSPINGGQKIEEEKQETPKKNKKKKKHKEHEPEEQNGDCTTAEPSMEEEVEHRKKLKRKKHKHDEQEEDECLEPAKRTKEEVMPSKKHKKKHKHKKDS